MSSIVNRRAAGAFGLQPTATRTTTTNGTGLDLQAYEGMVDMVLDSAAGGAGGTLDVTFEESDDNSTGWTAVPAADLNKTDGTTGNFAQVVNAASLQYRSFDVNKRKRYLRETHAIGGSGSFAYSVNIIPVKKYQT
jgi:hypothetical protein